MQSDLSRMIFQVSYNGDMKPTESISDDRWRAMVAHIKREYLAVWINGMAVRSDQG